MKFTVTQYLRSLLLVLAGAALTSCDASRTNSESSADDGQHSFAGETITVVIGSMHLPVARPSVDYLPNISK